MGAVGCTRSRERELVLYLDPAHVPDLASLHWLAPLLAAHPEIIRTRYFDTGDFAFRRRGFGFRVREAGGRVIQTIKTAGNRSGVLRDRMELDTLLAPQPAGVGMFGPWPDPALIPDPDLRDEVLAQLDVKPLRCLFETRILRRRAHVFLEDGTHLELALDEGDIRAGCRTMPVCELEFELLSGAPADLFILVQMITSQVPARLGMRSKAGRGYALAQAQDPAPVKAVWPRLDGHVPVEAAFSRIAASSLAHVLGNEAAVFEAGDVRGIHQMRVGLRRLRAGMGLFRRVFGAAQLDPLMAQARGLAVQLGTVRDLDVLITDILNPAESVLGRPGEFAVLQERVAVARADAMGKLIKMWSSRSDLADLALAIEGLLEEQPWRRNGGLHGGDAPWARPALPFARRMLRRRWRSAIRLGARLSDLTIEERHALRIAMKKLRYTSRFFEGLFDPARTAPDLAAFAKLQKTFGALNDVATASRLLPLFVDKNDPWGSGPRDLAAQVMALHETRAVEQWEDTVFHWTALCETPRFWEE